MKTGINQMRAMYEAWLKIGCMTNNEHLKRLAVLFSEMYRSKIDEAYSGE